VGTSGIELVHASLPRRASLRVPSLRIGQTTSSSQSRPESRSVSHSMFVDPAMTRVTPCMANTFAPSAQTPNTRPLRALEIDLSKILYKVVTPYISSAWSRALVDANLTQSYPNLVHDLSFGSSIGNPPPINFTFIPDNLPSAKIQPDYITNLINEEVASGRMDGPFTIEEAHSIYGGHFWMCPLGLVEKPGSTDL